MHQTLPQTQRVPAFRSGTGMIVRSTGRVAPWLKWNGATMSKLGTVVGPLMAAAHRDSCAQRQKTQIEI